MNQHKRDKKMFFCKPEALIEGYIDGKPDIKIIASHITATLGTYGELGGLHLQKNFKTDFSNFCITHLQNWIRKEITRPKATFVSSTPQVECNAIIPIRFMIKFYNDWFLVCNRYFDYNFFHFSETIRGPWEINRFPLSKPVEQTYIMRHKNDLNSDDALQLLNFHTDPDLQYTLQEYVRFPKIKFYSFKNSLDYFTNSETEARTYFNNAFSIN